MNMINKVKNRADRSFIVRLIFEFNEPIEIFYYNFMLADDIPDSDPYEWELLSSNNIQSLNTNKKNVIYNVDYNWELLHKVIYDPNKYGIGGISNNNNA